MSDSPRRRGTEFSAVQRLLVVVNRAAGTTDDDTLQAALSVLRSGADVTVAATADAEDLRRAVTGRGDRRLVIVGGDGSVHAAVTAAWTDPSPPTITSRRSPRPVTARRRSSASAVAATVTSAPERSTDNAGCRVSSAVVPAARFTTTSNRCMAENSVPRLRGESVMSAGPGAP